MRLGMTPSGNNVVDLARATARLKVMKIVMDPDDVQKLCDTSPIDYPSPVKMNKEASDNHIRAGRDVEISWNMWDVQQCACCGRVQPVNVDPTLPSKGPGVPFERQHLVNKYHKG